MRISKFIPEQDKLVSTGISTISVNNSVPLEIPISSKGVMELREQLVYERPIAPSRPLVIKADSDIGKELELKEDMVKLVKDENNAHYLKQVAQYELDFVWAIVIKGIALDFTNDKGDVLTDFESKKAVLLHNGLSMENINQLFTDIINLGHHQMESLDQYVQKSLGLTESVLKKLSLRSKKRGGTTVKTTTAYDEISLMAEYDLSPEEWEKVSTADRMSMNYRLLMKYHIEAEAMDRNEREAKLEKSKQGVMSSLPTFGNN